MLLIRNRIIQMVFVTVCLLAAGMRADGQAGAADKTGTGQAVPSQAAADPHEAVEKEILNELRQIRQLLEKQQQAQQQAPTPADDKARVSTAGFAIGSKDAPLTLVEFADYQCPYCRQFHLAVFERLKKDYIDTGKLRFISRDLPLDIHAEAFGAALAARCAGEQDKFWQMRDLLIKHADSLSPTAIANYATNLGLDSQRFHSCVEKATYTAGIREDAAQANSAGISVTPTFVIGRTAGDVVDGTKIVGSLPYESFEKVLASYQNPQVAQK
jgi:protein-disulfide isomerase